MKRFYETYAGNKKLSTLLRELAGAKIRILALVVRELATQAEEIFKDNYVKKYNY